MFLIIPYSFTMNCTLQYKLQWALSIFLWYYLNYVYDKSVFVFFLLNDLIFFLIFSLSTGEAFSRIVQKHNYAKGYQY